MPFVVGKDRSRGQWLRFQYHVCVSRILGQWNTSSIYQILHRNTLDLSRTELYFERIFIHRLGKHWAFQSNSTTRYRSNLLATIEHVVFIHNNQQVLPSATLSTVPSNTTLIYESSSIFSLPTASNSSLVILDSANLNASSADFYDMQLSVSNLTGWGKLPYIQDYFKPVLDFLVNSLIFHQYIKFASQHVSPFSYVNLNLMLLSFILLSILLHGRYVKKPNSPTVNSHLELTTPH